MEEENKKYLNYIDWKLLVSVVTLLIVFATGWQNLNIVVRGLQVKTENQTKQININTNKIEKQYDNNNKNQKKLMQEMYEIKLLLKDKEDRNK
jgi:cell division protein YceG involved in septum cleavage